MRSKTWFDEELRILRFRCSECMVAWGSRPSDYQQEHGDGVFCGLQDEQECEICGRYPTGSCRLWIIRKVSGDSDDQIGTLICSEQGCSESPTSIKNKRKVHAKSFASLGKTRGSV